MLSVEQASESLKRIVALCGDRQIIFTVSPIRHLGDGAHKNQLSKSTLFLALESVICASAAYFPAYEIVLDELRDYRFYADDLVHPSKLAVDIIWDRFIASFSPSESAQIRANEKASRRSSHRPLH